MVGRDWDGCCCLLLGTQTLLTKHMCGRAIAAAGVLHGHHHHSLPVRWLACANHMKTPHIMAGTAHSSTVGSYVSLSARLYLRHNISALRRCFPKQACLLPAARHYGWQHVMPLRAEDFTR